MITKDQKILQTTESPPKPTNFPTFLSIIEFQPFFQNKIFNSKINKLINDG